jgi:hypothetical protein
LLSKKNAKNNQFQANNQFNLLILKYYIGYRETTVLGLLAKNYSEMIELPQIVAAAKQSEHSSLPLELRTDPIQTPDGLMHVQIIGVPVLHSLSTLTASYFRQLLRLHTFEQREAANLFIKAMQDAHPNKEAISHILRSEKIRQHKPITSKQAIRAYRKFVLLEQTSYEFVDDGSNTNHKELRFMHGLVLKLKTFFR